MSQFLKKRRTYGMVLIIILNSGRARCGRRIFG